MLYSSILSDFHTELNNIEKTNEETVIKCKLGKLLCVRTLVLMRETVEKNGFETSKNEIYFFKNIKTVPMSYLINYTEIFKFEFGMPKLGFLAQKKYVQRHIVRINKFFRRHEELLYYMENKLTHFDEHYFIRDNVYNVSFTKMNYPYFKDALFNTSYDIVWAEIKGLKLFARYLNRRYLAFKNSNSTTTSHNMKWTGSSAAFVEFVYGCHAMGYFNNGNVPVATIFSELGEFLKVPTSNPSRTYNEIKNRKSSRIKFFKEVGEKLLEKMDREDGID